MVDCKVFGEDVVCPLKIQLENLHTKNCYLKFKDLTTEELKSRYDNLHFLLFDQGYSDAGDYFEMCDIDDELYRRGINVVERIQVKFEDTPEHDIPTKMEKR